MIPETGLVPDESTTEPASRGMASGPSVVPVPARDTEVGLTTPILVPGTTEGIEEVATLTPVAASSDDQPLRRNHDFWTVLLGQGVSSFGDAITNTAAPLLVLALTGSGFIMGIVGVLTTLPDLLIGLPAGAYADRWSRRSMMLWADVGRAILTALIPLSVWLDGPTIPVILLVTFPLNVLRVLWLAAYTAAVPGLVGRSRVARASAIFEAVFNIGWIVGPALAGLLAAAIGPGATIAIDAATFMVSALAMAFVRRTLRPDARPGSTRILQDIREGIHFVARQPTLRAVIALWTGFQVLTAGLTTALIYHVTVDLGLGADVVGVVLSAFALGALGGSLIAARFAFDAVGRVMLAGIVICGLLISLIASDPPVAVVIGASASAGVVLSNVLVSYITLRTQLSPDALLGRVGSTARTVSVGLMPLGALATGILLDLIGGTATLMAMGVAAAVTGLAFALLPRVRTARVPRRAAQTA